MILKKESHVTERFNLKSKYVFIDTSIYQAANFQFGMRDLGNLESLVNAGVLALLITSITIQEIRKHIRDEVAIAASAIQSFQKKGRILRNTPSFGRSPLFEKFDSQQVIAELDLGFERFLESKNVEVVSIDDVSPELVFRGFFESSPPFSGKKPNEFKDAFVLEALAIYADLHHVRIHVLSKDEDMRGYCDGDTTLLFSSDLGGLVDAALHIEHAEPLAFADHAFETVQQDVALAVEEYLSEQDFGIVCDGNASLRQLDVTVEDVTYGRPRVFSTNSSSASYGVSAEFDVVVNYFLSELVNANEQQLGDRSLLEIKKFCARYRKYLEVTVMVEFYENDIESVQLVGFNFDLEGGDNLWDDERIELSREP